MSGSRSCRGFHTWEEEAEHYHSLSPEQQRHWRLEGHAYYLSLRPENRDKSPEENWLQAEAEIQFGKDLHRLWLGMSAATDRGKKTLMAAIYFHAFSTKAPVATISEATLLPKDEEARQRLCRSVTDQLAAETVTLPAELQSIGQLVAFVIANYRHRQPRLHLFNW